MRPAEPGLAGAARSAPSSCGGECVQVAALAPGAGAGTTPRRGGGAVLPFDRGVAGARAGEPD